ncbi:MAG: peptide chain release factor N(5)-glutamine methyltransferase [Ignavibacteriaceae bacterium]
MLTVLEAINLSAGYLEKKGIEAPRINAELLLADILNCKRLDLYLRYDKPLTEEEKARYRIYLDRRGNYEPLQYILGKTEFYGIEFKVTPAVLIPRQETEILVEEIIDKLKDSRKASVLDIGTGSGNIAITLAKYLPDVEITAIDKSEDALRIAEENAAANKVSDRIIFLKQDIRNFIPGSRFDLIVSNPPYINKEDFTQLRPELRVYEPRSALTDESSGLSFYEIICSKAPLLLKSGGFLFFETAFKKADHVRRILSSNKFSNIKIKKDYSGIERVISGVFK